MKIYAIFNKDGSWYYFDHLENKPKGINAVEITRNQLEKYINLMNNDKKTISLVENKIVIIDNEIKKDDGQTQSKLIAQAKQLIKDNEWRWTNQIKWAEYSEEKRQQVTAYYKALVAVVNGESNTLPELV